MRNDELVVDGVTYTSTQIVDQIRLLNQLLPLVTNTCGRHNCNCLGSGAIKRVVDEAGLTPSQDKRGR